MPEPVSTQHDDNVVRICDYGRQRASADGPKESAVIIIMPVVRVERLPERGSK